jgi:hypothetical protein
MELEATLDKQLILTISCNGKVVSTKQVPGSEHWGRFTWKGETIQYQFVRKQTFLQPADAVYFYPINLPYKQNPISVQS